MGSFLNGLFMGGSPGVGKAEGTAEGLAGYGANAGEGNENAAGGYYNGILSGDPAKIAETLAPEIAANAQQTQQQKNTMAQFGSRSGGNTGAANGADSASRANIVNLIGGAQQGAAAGAAGLGENQVSSATTNNQIAGQLSQQELENLMNSIFGSGLSSGIGALEGGGIGKLFGPKDN